MFYLFFLLLCICVVLSDSRVSSRVDPASPMNGVMEMNSRNSKMFLNSGRLLFIEFYTSWCTHCKRLAPEMKKLGKLMSANQDIYVLKVNCEKEQELCQEFKVKGYPWMVYIPKDHHGERLKYEGERKAESIATLLNSILSRGISRRVKNLTNGPLYEERSVGSLIVYHEGDADSQSIIKALEDVKEDIFIGQVNLDHHPSELKMSKCENRFPCLYFYAPKSSEESGSRLPKVSRISDILEWIHDFKNPQVNIFSLYQAKKYDELYKKILRERSLPKSDFIDQVEELISKRKETLTSLSFHQHESQGIKHGPTK